MLQVVGSLNLALKLKKFVWQNMSSFNSLNERNAFLEIYVFLCGVKTNLEKF